MPDIDWAGMSERMRASIRAYPGNYTGYGQSVHTVVDSAELTITYTRPSDGQRTADLIMAHAELRHALRRQSTAILNERRYR